MFPLPLQRSSQTARTSRSGREATPLLHLTVGFLLAFGVATGAAAESGSESGIESGSEGGGETGSEIDAMIGAFLEAATQTEPEAAPLSLATAVKTAVENNPAIRARALVASGVTTDILAALAVFDPRLTSEGGYAKGARPVGTRLEQGESSSDTLRTENINTEIAIQKRLRTGGDMSLGWRNERESNSSINAIHDPAYRPALEIFVTQPLLRNIAALDDKGTVLVATADSERALAAFAGEVAGLISDVVTDYWAQVLAEAELEVSRHSVDLAEELVREAKRSAEVGTLPPVAVKEARAEAASRAEEMLRAENTLELATRDLMHRVMLVGTTAGVPLPIVPADRHQPQETRLDRTEILRAAMARRPEVLAAKHELARAQFVEARAKHRRLPELNLVGGFGLDGLAGEPKNPNEAVSYDGSYSDAVDEMLSGDFTRYRVGLELEVPFANAAAEAEHVRAEYDRKRAEHELRDVLSQVTLDLDRSLADTASALKRVEAAKLARELAEENLRNQRRRYELGTVTTKDVLDFQQKLSAASAAEVQAISDHALAITSVDLAGGTLLERFGVELQATPNDDRPWWARF